MNKQEILNEISQIIFSRPLGNLFPFSYDGDDTIDIEHPVYNEIKIVGDTLELYKGFIHIFNYHIPYQIDLNDSNWKSILLEILLTY